MEAYCLNGHLASRILWAYFPVTLEGFSVAKSVIIIKVT